MSFHRPLDWQQRFLESLEAAITRAGSMTKLAKHLGINYGTIIAWRRGAIPSEEKLHKLEAYLNEEKK